MISCSTYLHTYWLLLVCAQTGDQSHKLGVLRQHSNQLSNLARTSSLVTVLIQCALEKAFWTEVTRCCLLLGLKDLALSIGLGSFQLFDKLDFLCLLVHFSLLLNPSSPRFVWFFLKVVMFSKVLT